MSETEFNDSAEAASRKHAADISGQSRIVINLAARWLGQLIVVVSGFIIPRLIDDSLGPAALGIWDFGWATVSYARFIGFGVAGGLNRFVALHNAERAYEDLKRAVSSTFCVQVVLALLATLATATVAWFAPAILDDIPPDQVRDSQLIIAFLGLNLAVRMLFWPVRAILTGYHYTNVTAAVTAFGDILLLIGMYVTLKTGGGLAELGMVLFSLALFTETLRFIIARRIYPYRMLIPSSVHWSTMRKMIGFGVTNSLTGLPKLLVIQTTAVVLAASAGPAALAVLARPLALFQHIGTLVMLYAFLLTPMAASLHGLKRESDLKSVLLTALLSSFAMTIPPLALLAGFGDVIIELWMGKDYVVPVLAPILGAALILPYGHMVAMRILVGVDSHTRVAAWSLGVTAVVFTAGIWAAGTIGWSTVTAAVVIGTSLLSGPGIVVIVGACRRFGVGFGEYLSRALLPPLMCNSPLLAIIAASRWFDEQVTILEAAAWCLAGGLTVVGLYWKFLLTEPVRAKLARKLGFRRRTVTADVVDYPRRGP